MLLLVIGIRLNAFFRLSLFISEKEDKKDPVLLEQIRMAYADHVLSWFAGSHPWAAVWHVWDNLVFESPLFDIWCSDTGSASWHEIRQKTLS